jgi:MscS family membrane protein
LDNLGVRPIRRVKFNIGLTYGTTIDQMKTIVAQLEEMINAHPKTTNGDARVRFQEFGGSSLDVLVIYFVDSPNWDLLIDTRQEINFSIIEIIQTNGCDFAFPTTSVYLEK